MWMMGYNDGGDFNSIQDSFNGRKLRTLVPRPSTATAATTNPPCLNRIHGADFLALNHHFAMSSEQTKRELSTQQVVVSSRWNPTPEQLQTLEELYRRGTRTPSAEQIQHITSQLRRYGKIEGKNVFYWFQNHKARERQKRRRQQESASNLELPDINILNSDKKESQGVNRTVFEGEQTKNWASLTKSSTNTEKTSTKGSAKVTEAECKTDGWLQFDENIGAELQERRTLAERNATWQLMHLSCSSSSSSSLSPTNLLNSFTSSSSSSSATAAITVTTATIPPSTLFNINTALLMQQSIIHSQDFNIFRQDLISPSAAGCRGGGGEAQTTLQLFPLGSRPHENNVECDCEKDDEEELSGGPAMDAANATPFQFFEFLPLKN